MDKIKVITKPDKSISIIYPVKKNYKIEDFNRDMEKCGFTGLPFEDIDISELPASREFRKAWEKEPGKPIVENQIKKDKVISDKLKAERQKAFLEAL